MIIFDIKNINIRSILREKVYFLFSPPPPPFHALDRLCNKYKDKKLGIRHSMWSNQNEKKTRERKWELNEDQLPSMAGKKKDWHRGKTAPSPPYIIATHRRHTEAS